MNNEDEIIFIRQFGERLRYIRIEKKLSQEDLANDADIPINQVGRIERAEIATSLKTIFKLSKALDIDVVDFFITDIIIKKENNN